MVPSIALVVLFASLVHSSPVEKRKDFPDEAIYLVSCASQDPSMQLSLHDYVYWYGDDADGRNGDYPRFTSEPTDPGVHDGMIYNIDWSSGTKERPITADVDGRLFQLYDLKDNGAKKGEKVMAKAELGTEANMDCYKDDQSIADSLKNDSIFKCKVKYRCTRGVHWTRVGELNLYNATTTIRGFDICDKASAANPYKAFSHYMNWASSMTPPNTPYLLHKTEASECSISFHTVGVDQNDTSPVEVGDVQRFWTDAIARQSDLATTIDSSKSVVVGDTIHPYCQIPYPAGGYLAIKSTQDSNPQNHFQAEYHFQVTCGSKNKCDSRTSIAFLSGLVGALAALTAPGPLAGVITGFVNGFNAICAFG